MDDRAAGMVPYVARDDASGSWALARGARRTWSSFCTAWSDTPKAAWRRWLLTMIVGFIVVAALSVALTLITRDRLMPRGLQSWDEQTLLAIKDNGLVSFSNAILLESFGNLAYMIPAVLLAAIIAARSGRPLLSISFVLVYVLQRPLVLLGWQIWDRARPTLIMGGDAAPPLHSFPSGHSALAVSFYGLLAWVWIRSSRSTLERLIAVLLLGLLATAVGWARLRLGTHWPSDVIAGTALGVAWGAVVAMAINRAERAGGR